jgi:hypothetical protein
VNFTILGLTGPRILSDTSRVYRCNCSPSMKFPRHKNLASEPMLLKALGCSGSRIFCLFSKTCFFTSTAASSLPCLRSARPSSDRLGSILEGFSVRCSFLLRLRHFPDYLGQGRVLCCSLVSLAASKYNLFFCSIAFSTSSASRSCLVRRA